MGTRQAATEAILHTELSISFVVFPRHVFWALTEDSELGNVTKKYGLPSGRYVTLALRIEGAYEGTLDSLPTCSGHVKLEEASPCNVETSELEALALRPLELRPLELEVQAIPC